MKAMLCKATLVVAGSMTLAGCAGFYAPLETLIGHEEPVISWPASVGAFVTGVASVPLAVLALPVTLPVGLANDAPLAPLAPVFAVAQVGAIVLGGLPWLVWG
jgi:hypothetical protein